MATMKNRVIRADDNLWNRVVAEATRRGRKVPEFVRRALWDAAETPLCFHCGNPASNRIDYNVTDAFRGDPLQSFIRSGEGALVDDFTPIRVTIHTCAAHYQPASEAVLEVRGGCGGYALTDEEDDRWILKKDGHRYFVDPAIRDDPCYQRVLRLLRAMPSDL